MFPFKRLKTFDANFFGVLLMLDHQNDQKYINILAIFITHNFEIEGYISEGNERREDYIVIYIYIYIFFLFLYPLKEFIIEKCLKFLFRS